MSDSEHDDDFEAYLKRRVPIDQRLKSVDRLEPPQELDRVIIGKARNAIQSSPPVPMYRAPKWALPVGLAATLLIAFSIVWDLGVRSGRHQQAMMNPGATAPGGPGALAPAPPAAARPTTPSVAVLADSGVAKVDPAASSNAEASAQTYARMQPPPIKTVPWPPLRRSAAKPASSLDAASDGTSAIAMESPVDLRSRAAERRVAEKRLRSEESDRLGTIDVGSATVATTPAPDVSSATVAASGPHVASPPTEAAPTSATSARVASPADARLPAAIPVAPPQVASSAGTSVPLPSPPAPPAAPPPRPLVDATASAGAPTPMRLAAAPPKVSAVTFDGTKVIEPRSTDRFDAVAAGPMARAVAPAAANPSTEAVAATERREHPDPKTWLDQIQKMRVTGLATRAEQEMKRFRDAYPTWPTTSPDGDTQ